MTPFGAPRVPGPGVDLAAFQAQVRNGIFHVYKTRALDVICRIRKCTVREAREHVKVAVLSLEAGDYSHTLRTPNGQVQDVYGRLIQGEGWYLKIEIQMHDGEPGIVSCHPAEHDLSTVRGTVSRSRRRFR